MRMDYRDTPSNRGEVLMSGSHMEFEVGKWLRTGACRWARVLGRFALPLVPCTLIACGADGVAALNPGLGPGPYGINDGPPEPPATTLNVASAPTNAGP